MSTEFQPPAGISPEEFKRWQENEERRLGSRSATKEGIETEDLIRIMKENLPETAPPLPYAMTEEGKRLAGFRKVCPEEFMQKIQRDLLKNPAAHDAVCKWGGMFKGLVLTGPTDMGKSRSVWSVLGRLYVEENRNFAWFPVKRLMTEFLRYESKDLADEFYRITPVTTPCSSTTSRRSIGNSRARKRRSSSSTTGCTAHTGRASRPPTKAACGGRTRWAMHSPVDCSKTP
jgi:hypothetical protein